MEDQVNNDIATEGKWQDVNFVNKDGSPIKTHDDIISIISESVRKGEGLYLAGVCPYGDNIVICYTGNGPKAKANARLIAVAPELKSLLRRTMGLIRELYQNGSFVQIENGSVRERQAIALLLRMANEHESAILQAEKGG